MKSQPLYPRTSDYTGPLLLNKSMMPSINQSFYTTRKELIQLEIELVRRTHPILQEGVDAPTKQHKLSYDDN